MIRVQMIGTQRSGSNLLRLMLDQGGSLLAPPSAHELRDLIPLMPLYDPLSAPANRRRLAGHLAELVRANALAWPDDLVDAERLLDHVASIRLAGFVIALYDQAATRAARLGWVSKCLENVHFFDHLKATRMPIRYLHLVRDPRDVALSFRGAPIGPKDPRVIATMWRHDQRTARDIVSRCGDRGSVQRYEDLVLRPVESLSTLFARLGVPFTESALDYHKRSDAAAAAALSPIWSNLTRPPMSDRVSAHERDADPDGFLRQVEELVFDEMVHYGYEPTRATSARALTPDELEAAKQDDARLRAETVRAHSQRNQSAHTRREELLATLRTALPTSTDPVT